MLSRPLNVCKYAPSPPHKRSHNQHKNIHFIRCVRVCVYIACKFYLWTFKWTHSSRKIIAIFVILVNYIHLVKVENDSEGTFFVSL